MLSLLGVVEHVEAHGLWQQGHDGVGQGREGHGGGQARVEAAQGVERYGRSGVVEGHGAVEIDGRYLFGHGVCGDYGVDRLCRDLCASRPRHDGHQQQRHEAESYGGESHFFFLMKMS